MSNRLAVRSAFLNYCNHEVSSDQRVVTYDFYCQLNDLSVKSRFVASSGLFDKKRNRKHVMV